MKKKTISISVCSQTAINPSLRVWTRSFTLWICDNFTIPFEFNKFHDFHQTYKMADIQLEMQC